VLFRVPKAPRQPMSRSSSNQGLNQAKAVEIFSNAFFIPFSKSINFLGSLKANFG
jgi:hypothetical protein